MKYIYILLLSPSDYIYTHYTHDRNNDEGVRFAEFMRDIKPLGTNKTIQLKAMLYNGR